MEDERALVKVGVNQLRIVFTPRHVHARVAIHSIATVTGAVVAVRMGWGKPMWADIAWYAGGFLGFHIVLTPFMAAWYLFMQRADSWVRSVVQEELMHFEMKSYERQLQRVIPALGKRTDDDSAQRGNSARRPEIGFNAPTSEC